MSLVFEFLIRFDILIYEEIMSIKLSPAQSALLGERAGRFIPTYKPGLRLIDLGLIDAAQKMPNGVFKWVINAAGENVLAALNAANG